MYRHSFWFYKNQSVRNTSWNFEKIKIHRLVESLQWRNTFMMTKMIFNHFWDKLLCNWCRKGFKTIIDIKLQFQRHFFMIKGSFPFFLNHFFSTIKFISYFNLLYCILQSYKCTLFYIHVNYNYPLISKYVFNL